MRLMVEKCNAIEYHYELVTTNLQRVQENSAVY